MDRPKNSPQLQAMLKVVGEKLGMQPQDAAKFRQALANPQKLSQMLGSKQAKALYEKLTKGT